MAKKQKAKAKDGIKSGIVDCSTFRLAGFLEREYSFSTRRELFSTRRECPVRGRIHSRRVENVSRRVENPAQVKNFSSANFQFCPCLCPTINTPHFFILQHPIF